MADILRYVDYNVSGGLGDGTSRENAYATLVAWQTAEATNLVTAMDTHRVLVFGAGTVISNFDITSAWTTSVDYDLTIEAGPEDYASPVSFDETKFYFHISTTWSRNISVIPGFVTIKGFQLSMVNAGGVVRSIYCQMTTSGAVCKIQDCRIRLTGNGINPTIGVGVLYNASYPKTVRMDNCIIEGTGVVGERGVVDDGPTINNFDVYNSIITKLDVGCYNPNIVENSAVFACSDEFYLPGTITNCATDDGEGSNPIVPSNWANEFFALSSGDYTVLMGSVLINAGLGPSADAEVLTIDMIGNTRSGLTCTIGTAEYVALIYSITGVTYNKSGEVLVGCQVSLFKHLGSGVYSYIGTVSSDVVTGVFSFEPGDTDASYMVVARNDNTPNVFDVSDNNLQPIPGGNNTLMYLRSQEDKTTPSGGGRQVRARVYGG